MKSQKKLLFKLQSIKQMIFTLIKNKDHLTSLSHKMYGFETKSPDCE